MTKFSKEEADRMDVCDKVYYLDRFVNDKLDSFKGDVIDHFVCYLEGIGISVPVLPEFIIAHKDNNILEGYLMFDRVRYGYGYGKNLREAVIRSVFYGIARHELGLDFRHNGLLFDDIYFENDPKPVVTIMDMLSEKETWFDTLNKLEYGSC